MLTAKIFSDVIAFLDHLPPPASARCYAALHALECGRFGGLITRTLRGKVKELKVGQTRLIYFAIEPHLYVIDAFKKQSRKTPKHTVEQALTLYKQILKK